LLDLDESKSGLRCSSDLPAPGTQTDRAEQAQAAEDAPDLKRLASPLTILGVLFLSEVAYCARAAISSEFSAMS